MKSECKNNSIVKQISLGKINKQLIANDVPIGKKLSQKCLALGNKQEQQAEKAQNKTVLSFFD
ncbi:hypothetical protein L6E_22450 [Enterococcus hirae]|nr:hypothetical protein L6E_22450 [Enterococcus hirae]GMC06360.1 hypothetical protein K4F_13630 [Enterococcus hirae]